MKCAVLSRESGAAFGSLQSFGRCSYATTERAKATGWPPPLMSPG